MKFVESGKVELKLIVNADFKKEVVSFANTDGGEIFIGVADDGNVVGVEAADQIMAQISSSIRDGIRPDLTPYTTIEEITAERKPIIRVSVSRGGKRPYHLADKGLKPSGVYVRHGVSSVPADEDTIRQMIRESDGMSFDQVRSMNQELTFDYAAAYFKERGIDFSNEKKQTLGLISSEGYYTNAAFLLSDQCSYSIKCAVYEGRSKAKFKARKEFTGSVLKQLEEAYMYLELNNDVSSDFEGLKRVDHYEYPRPALREALLNTIVHRDYDYTGSVLINLFDDRMEFVSIGGLVKGITMTDILHGISQPRNMVVASVFYRLELIESYGTGIQRILENYAGHQVAPQFLPGPASFLVVLPNMNNSDGTSGGILSEEERVLQLFRQMKDIKRKDVQNLLGCSSFPANRILNQLLQKGRIARMGNGPGTKYVLNANTSRQRND